MTTQPVREVLVAALLARLETLKGDHPDLVIELDRPEGEPFDTYPALTLLTDAAEGDEILEENIYQRILLARLSVVGWVAGADRPAARAAAAEMSAAIVRMVCLPATSNLGTGWIDTAEAGSVLAGAHAATDALAAFRLTFAVTYQHAPGDPTDPACI